jgi:STE24 endopeptidase
MNIYLILVLAILVLGYLLDVVSGWLNLRHLREELPDEFEGFYDAERYATSQRYLRDNTRFGLLRSSLGTGLLLVFIPVGGFDLVDRIARAAEQGEIVTGLLFGGILLLAGQLMAIPFSWYDTFVIEERYGFNKTTPRTFAIDLVKGLALSTVIGAPVFALILWFFGAAGSLAWMLCWGAVVVIQVFLIFVAPYVIMPLFNKFTPLEEGALRQALEDYAREQQFRMKGVYQMDGSRRSAKSNAFFTGFGHSRRIVLYDTLIKQHTVPELVAVVAHEMGHYKKRHIVQAMVRAVVTTGITFYLLSLFINNPGLFAAFGMDHVSVYASLVFFGFLYTPIGVAVSAVEHAISRRQEFDADAYAAETTDDAEAMINALKKLSVDNLSNLTPHPMKVFLDYSHPPVLRRIEALRRQSSVIGDP